MQVTFTFIYPTVNRVGLHCWMYCSEGEGITIYYVRMVCDLLHSVVRMGENFFFQSGMPIKQELGSEFRNSWALMELYSSSNYPITFLTCLVDGGKILNQEVNAPSRITRAWCGSTCWMFQDFHFYFRFAVFYTSQMYFSALSLVLITNLHFLLTFNTSAGITPLAGLSWLSSYHRHYICSLQPSPFAAT